MKSLLTLLLASTALAVAGGACDCGRSKAISSVAAVESPAEPKTHPVKGVVVALMTEKTALLVKHEEVPGVMRAMTMMFKVDPAVLERVRQGDAIKALMSRRADGWWLTAVEVITPPKE